VLYTGPHALLGQHYARRQNAIRKLGDTANELTIVIQSMLFLRLVDHNMLVEHA
jgi:hypothetical protein